MALTPGARLGFYEVSAEVGEGGTGEVYQPRHVVRPVEGIQYPVHAL